MAYSYDSLYFDTGGDMSAETTTRNAPYAYPNAVLRLIHRYRAQALPEPITPISLQTFGVSQSNAPGYCMR